MRKKEISNHSKKSLTCQQFSNYGFKYRIIFANLDGIHLLQFAQKFRNTKKGDLMVKDTTNCVKGSMGMFTVREEMGQRPVFVMAKSYSEA